MNQWFFCFTAIQLILIDIQPGCNSNLPSTVNFGVVGGGGVPPYSVVDTEDCVGGEGLSAMCKGSKLIVMDVFNSTVEMEVPPPRDDGGDFLGVNLRWERQEGAEFVVMTADAQGGTPPYTFKWNDGSTGMSVVAWEDVDMSVLVVDSRKCAISVNLMVSPPSPRHDEKDCSRRISECDKLPVRFAVVCLKKLMFPPCIAKAAFVLALRLVSRGNDRDHGPAYVALRLALPWFQRENQMMMTMMRQLLEYDSLLSSLLELYVTEEISHKQLLNRSFESMCGGGGAAAGSYDTLVISPQGFDNDPIFAPQLVHGGRKVACLVNAHHLFKSAFVRVLVFPPSLECDVDLAASYVMLVMDMLKPKWVFPGDSEGILLLGKLLHSRSYPPPSLSKLAPGHERFAPKEVIVSEEDGIREIMINVER